VGPTARNIVLGALERAARRLSFHLGPDVAITWNDLPRRRHLVLLYLDAKLPLMGGGGGGSMLVSALTYEP
jgi:hypothetical protein